MARMLEHRMKSYLTTGGYLFLCLLWVGLMGGGLYTIIHFINKFW